MALPSYTVTVFESPGGTQHDITSTVQEFSITRGVQMFSDSLRAGTGYVRGRRPDLLPTIEVGMGVRIEESGTVLAFYRVNDFRTYFGTIASLDEYEITLEDTLAALGRTTGFFSWANATTGQAINTVGTAAGLTVSQLGTFSSLCSNQTLTNENALEVVSRLVTQEQGLLMNGSSSYDSLLVFASDFAGAGGGISVFDCSDDGTGTNPIKYDGFELAGVADNFANFIVVEPAGLSQSTAGTGTFSTIVQTYNKTQTDASNLANFLLGAYNQQDQGPQMLSARYSANTAAATVNMAQAVGNDVTASLPQLRIKHRGTTYDGFIIGATVTGLLDDIIYTYYLATPTYFSQFILNSATYGVLDQNLLGY